MQTLLKIFITITATFGIIILIVWVVGHFFCESIKVSLSDIGACLGGIAAVIGLYSGVQKYFESKDKKNISLRRSEVINVLMGLRNFLDALYTVSTPFVLPEDPERPNEQDYRDYLEQVRRYRYSKFTKEIEQIKKDYKQVDALFNKEIVELFNDIYKKWQDIEQNFFLWQASGDALQGQRNTDLARYFNQSKLTKDEYDAFSSKISNIIKKINPNYDKKTEDIVFE